MKNVLQLEETSEGIRSKILSILLKIREKNDRSKFTNSDFSVIELFQESFSVLGRSSKGFNFVGIRSGEFF